MSEPGPGTHGPRETPRSFGARRPRLAAALAVIALVAAVIGAAGPADRVRTTYSWPPQTLPAGAPSSFWYTPLLLIRHRPESVAARVPCSLPPALPAATSPVTVLATARYPERNVGLALTRGARELVIGVGDRVIDRVPLPAGPADGTGCAFLLRISGGRWSLEGGPNDVSHRGDLESMPAVTGLFSALDLRSGTPPSVEVTTAVHSTTATMRQSVAWTIAAFCALAALALAAFGPGQRRAWARARAAARGAVEHRQPADMVVGASLFGWWLIAPVVSDDGWIFTRLKNFEVSGGFSAYYNTFGANQPLGYWLEWAYHWLTELSSALLVLRVPALVFLAATWVLCRWILARTLSPSVHVDPAAIWVLAGAFLLGAVAWGMTLRPEPELALLVTGVLACTVRFLERGSAAPLALSALLIALAVNAHPAGIISIAPLLVATPTLYRWARNQLAVAATLAASGFALLAVLAFVGSDVAQRRADAQTFRLFGDATWSWRDEISRYAIMSTPGLYQTPPRRLSVALMILAVVAWLLWRQRKNGLTLLNLPGATIAVALVLLIATPSKWPYHFGALLGVTAVAVAAETARLRREAARSHGLRPLPFLVISAGALAAAWSWKPRDSWNPLDLQTYSWILGFEPSRSSLALAAALPLFLLVAASIIAILWGRGDRLFEVPWRVAGWTAAMLAAPAIAFTGIVLIADAARTPAWTLTRQNAETLVRGNQGCGLADDALVAATGSMRSLATVGRGRSQLAPWLPDAPVPGLRRFALGPTGSGTASTPWFELPGQSPIGLFVAGRPAPTDKLELEWGRRYGDRIETLGSGRLVADFETELHSVVRWRFFAAPELPSAAEGAQTVRITARSSVIPGAPIAVTAPVTYANEHLIGRFERDGPSLILYHLVFYFPCMSQPRLGAGAVAVPQRLVAFRSTWPIGTGTSPFDGIFDLYHLDRFALADSEGLPSEAAVYEVDTRIPGAELAAHEKLTGSS